MASLDPNNGKTVEGLDEVVQSVSVILKTLKGTRVMRPNFGSNLPLFIDQPLNDQTLLGIYTATLDAISRQEPRFKPVSVRTVANGLDTGSFSVYIRGVYQLQEVELDAITIG